MVYLYPTSQRPVRSRISEIHLTVEITKGQSQNRTSLCFFGQQRHVWTKSPSTKRLVGEKPRDTPPPQRGTTLQAIHYSNTLRPLTSSLLFSTSHIRTARYGSALYSADITVVMFTVGLDA